MSPYLLELLHRGVGQFDSFGLRVADGEGDGRVVIPFKSGPTSPLDIRRFAVLLVHLEPETDFVIGRHVLLEKGNKRPGNQRIELK